MYTGIAGICKQSGWRQKLPSIYIQQLQTQSMQALPAFANSRAEYRNYQALYTAITHSMYKGIAGICKQSGRIKELPCICIPRLRAQCVQESVAFVNNLAEKQELPSIGIPQLHTQCIRELPAFVTVQLNTEIPKHLCPAPRRGSARSCAHGAAQRTSISKDILLKAH